MITEKKVLRLVFVFLIVLVGLGEIKSQETSNDEVIKVNTTLISVPVIVSDRQDRYVSGLKAENFSIYQDGTPQKIEYFISEEAPINVAILLDTSRSTQRVLDKIQDSAVEFIRRLRPEDKAMIVSFDNDIEILSELTSNQRTLERAVWDAQIGESVGTVLNDAVYEVINQKMSTVKGRKAIILLTDGKDAGSYIDRDELLDKLDESDTLIYSIFYDTLQKQRRFEQDDDRFPNRGGGMNRQRRFPNPNQQRRQMINDRAIEFLENISDVTAGRFYQNDITDLNTTFSLIANELRKQYLIGYYPENIEDGKLYQIKVKVDKSNVVVRAKNSYRGKTE